MRIFFRHMTPLLLLLLLATSANAKPIVADLAIRSIAIDHNFTGMDILMFGARNDIGNIVVVVRGPESDYIVRKKERIAGIWVNKESVTFKKVNGLYSIASTVPLYDVRNEYLLSGLDIGVDQLHLNTDSEKLGLKEFRDAFIRHKRQNNLFTSDVNPVTFWGETLFRTELKFPENIERGMYTAEVYLFNDGQLSAMQSTPIRVEKIGFEAFVFDAAYDHAILYGLACISMAIILGWVANTIYRRL